MNDVGFYSHIEVLTPGFCLCDKCGKAAFKKVTVEIDEYPTPSILVEYLCEEHSFRAVERMIEERTYQK